MQNTSPSTAADAPVMSEKHDLEKAKGVKEEVQTTTHVVPPAEADILIVNWEENDAENPRNWSARRKWATTILVSCFCFISPLSSSMIAPASEQMAEDIHIEGDFVRNLSVSIFILAYAFGPLLLGPLSELYGRSVVLQISNMWFVAWNLGCAFAQNTGEIIAFRLLSGLGGSAPFSIGGAVIADLFEPSQRGRAIAMYSVAPLLGPVVGPIAGGWIAQRSTWRWVFWSASAVAFAIMIAGLIILRETYTPVLLERRAKKIKAKMSEENDHTYSDVQTPYQEKNRNPRTVITRALGRPFVLLVTEPILMIMGLWMIFIYGLMYLLLITVPDVFTGVYGQEPGIASLHYIAYGLGIGVANQINAQSLDGLYKYFTAKHGGVGRPEYRTPGMFPAAILQPIGLLIYGWTVQYRVHWIVPDIGLFFAGAGIILAYQCVQSYVIDVFTLYSASALATMTCLRSLAGFGFPIFAPAMYASLGYGKGNTVLAAIAIAIGGPIPWLLWKYGQAIREKSKHAQKSGEA